MLHQQLVRNVPGAHVAVLFMHGIAGSPEHFRQGCLPLEDMIPGDWSMYNLLYDGHGGQVEDFSRSSMTAWKKQVHEAFLELCRSHQQVILVGHSMGTLFAVHLALEYPEKVPLIFLIDCPLRLGVKLSGALNLIKLSYGLLDYDDPVQGALGRATSIRQTWKSWKYIPWVLRVAELVLLMYQTASDIPKLSVKTVAFQSRLDEMVSCGACKLLRKSGRVEVHGLKYSTHFYYPPGDADRVIRRFGELLKAVKNTEES